MKAFAFMLMFVLAFSVTGMAQDGCCKDKAGCTDCTDCKDKSACTTSACTEGKKAGSCDSSSCASDDMMAFVAKYGQPGEHHKYLQMMTGRFTSQTKCYQPDGKVMESQGMIESKMVLGGRYLVENYKEEKFEGMGVIGYDNLKQKYVSTWTDTMSTSIFMTEGTVDASGKVLTMWSAEEKCPMTGKVMKFRTVTTMVDDNHHNFEIYCHCSTDNSVMKLMEISYTRARTCGNESEGCCEKKAQN